jgi:hypothetical protein
LRLVPQPGLCQIVIEAFGFIELFLPRRRTRRPGRVHTRAATG